MNYIHGFSPLYSPFGFGAGITALFIAAIVWTVVLKGFALWYSGRAGQKGWFIALLIVNTLGILEIIYLLFFCPKTGMGANTPANTPSTPSSSGPTA